MTDERIRAAIEAHVHCSPLYMPSVVRCARAIEAERDAMWSEKVQEIEKDAERFIWWVSDKPKIVDVEAFLQGVREGWSLDQWRAYCDKCMVDPMKPYAPSFDEAELAALTQKGREAWKDVGNASDWVEEQRGNSEPAELSGNSEQLAET